MSYLLSVHAASHFMAEVVSIIGGAFGIVKVLASAITFLRNLRGISHKVEVLLEEAQLHYSLLKQFRGQYGRCRANIPGERGDLFFDCLAQSYEVWRQYTVILKRVANSRCKASSWKHHEGEIEWLGQRLERSKTWLTVLAVCGGTDLV